MLVPNTGSFRFFVNGKRRSFSLAGRTRPGEGEKIHAVIWLCDLRDSTRLSQSVPVEEFFRSLNEFFDCTAGAVLEHGGEILSYIGDAVFGPGGPAEPGRLRFGTGAPTVHAVVQARGRTGELIWEHRLGANVAMRGMSLYDDKLFVALSNARLVALDARTGRIAWNVEMPDGRRTTGEVESVGDVARVEEDEPGAGGGGKPTVEVLISLAFDAEGSDDGDSSDEGSDDGDSSDEGSDDESPDAEGSGSFLDRAPVKVLAEGESREDVLAAPVGALIALSGGGYGLSVVGGDGEVEDVPVETGWFSDGLVEVTGDGIDAGTEVVVPE